MGVERTRFEELIRIRFDNAAIKSTLLAELYGKRQGERENSSSFLQTKYLLFQRLKPEEIEANKVSTILQLMRPNLRQTIKPYNLPDLSELMAKALEAEKDEEEESFHKEQE